MNRRSEFLRLAFCVVTAVTAAGGLGVSLTSCSPDDAPVPPVAGKPLPQDGRIAVEIPIAGEYKTVHITRHALEDLAARQCARERSQRTDTRICSGSYGSTLNGINAQDEDAAMGAVKESPNLCVDALCFERNEVCAGYFIEEVAKSPAAREIVDDSSPGAGGGDPLFRLDRLELKASEALALGLPIDPLIAQSTSFPKIRFQPLAAPGKAAALRGAMNRFRRSTVIAGYMNQDVTVTNPPQDRCTVQFRQRDESSDGPNFAAVGATKPGWTDTLLETFIDGSTQYTVLIPETVQAMQASAEFQVRGRASDLDEVETQWNGSYDSVTAIGKFLAFGDDQPVPQASFEGGHYVMAESGGLLASGPKGAPTCPPVPSTSGGSAALTWSKMLKISPAVLADLPLNTTYATALAWAYNEDLYNQKFINTPYDTATVLKRINSSPTDVKAAGDYLTAQEKKNNSKPVLDTDNPTLPSGFHHVRRLVSEPKPPPNGVMTASFLGSQTTNNNIAPSSKGYSQHGVIAAVDQIKMTAQMFQTATVNATYVKAPILASIQAVVDEAKVYVGSQRVEFLFGVQPLNATDTNAPLRVYVHGVPAQSEEKYAVVLGLDGARCVSTGQINTKNDCNPADYLVQLPAPGPLDARMSDLAGGTIVSPDFPTLKLPGNPSAPIPVPGWVFLLRQKNQSSGWNVIAGAETGAAPNNQFITVDGNNTNTFTRRLFAPIAEDGVSTLQQIMESSQLASVDDCSRPQDSCAGLPVTMFPPLESEVNGDQSSLPYERSWKKYLDEARQAADTADQLGREVVQSGLAMDQRREAAIEELRNLCGADADETTGCGLDPKDNKTVTLGDAPVCLWATKGQMCKCQDQSGNAVECTGALKNCPLALPPESGKTCDQLVQSLLAGQQVEKVIPVADALKLAPTPPKPPATKEPVCQVFEDLRTGNVLGLDFKDFTPQQIADAIAKEDTPTNREKVIRERLMSAWGRQQLSAIAAELRYREQFGDNYLLTYNGAVIFDTKRPTTQSNNTDANAPCTITAVDASTGATFWTRPVACFVSGTNQQQCQSLQSLPLGVGIDGCPTLASGGSFENLSKDTEPDALRARWAWGFGHLRRSVATLGIITGQLNGMMDLSRVLPPYADDGDGNLPFYPDWGAYQYPQVTDKEPTWILHGQAYGSQDAVPDSRCIIPGGTSGPNGDLWRDGSGRPVNANGWLPLWAPTSSGSYNRGGSGTSYYMTGFPCKYANGSPSDLCVPIGLDPQMPYCDLPDAPVPQITHYFSTLTSSSFTSASSLRSGRVGLGTTQVGRIFARTEWAKAQSDMWESPEQNFCDNQYDASPKGAIWRAFCAVPDDVSEQDPGFASKAIIQTGPPTYYSRSAVGGQFVASKTDKDHGAMLFDQTKPNPNGFAVPDFQYPVDRRNIYDAMELACHALTRPVTAVVDCAAALGPNYVPKSADEFAEVVSCYAARIRHALGTYVIGDIPQPVIDAYVKNSGVLAPGTSIGGGLFDEMSNESAALQGVARDYDHIEGTLVQLASLERQLDAIEKKHAALDAQLLANRRAEILKNLGQAVQILTQAAVTAVAPSAFVSGAGESAIAGAITAVALFAAAAAYEQEAISEAQKANVQDGIQERLGNLQQAFAQMEAARDTEKDVGVQLNALSNASKRIRLILQKGQVAVAKAKFADYAGDEQTDPQYVNIVMRRTYNTALVRYLRALDRAKKAAFIARRAVELRFGVDLQRMTSPLKLVDAPSTWATRVCSMGGIDYSKIRAPDGESPVSGFDFGAPPLQGDDYASSFIGDYVSLLEDFVKSYPIDYPLKDGDDTAVISLRDDILRTSTACTEPSKNLLYYSSEIDKRDEARASLSTKGWFTRACSTTGGPEFPASADWTGCVQSYVMGPPALAPDANGQGQGMTSDNVSLNGLPTGAIPYRFTNVPCTSGGGIVCPSQTTNTAVGALAQELSDLGSGYYAVSVYAHLAPGSFGYSNGNSAQVRVVRRSNETVVASKNFAPTGANWEREEIVFVADPQETYRLELVPSVQQVSIVGPGDYGVWLAAPQVERITTKVQTSSPNATGWQRTDTLRLAPSLTCDDPNGDGLRRRFTRTCQYVCKGGVKKDCGSSSPDAVPSVCYYEAQFAIPLEKIESGALIPSGQIAIGNFNFRHNELGLNVTGTGVTNCDGIPQNSCYDNGFIQYTLVHNGDVLIRNWTGASLPAHMDTAFIEHGKALAAERVITNPPSGSDLGLMSPYMKGEYKGRPLEGLYTLRIYDSPSLRWDRVRDIQLVAKYHYWTRFSK